MTEANGIGKGKGRRRSLEEREADLMRQLDDLKRKKRAMALREKAESDAIAQTYLMIMRSIDRSFLVPDVADDPETSESLVTMRQTIIDKLHERGIPIGDETLDED